MVQCLTWLYDPGLGPKVGQVHIGFPAVYNGVWVFAGSVSRGPVCHGHLQEAKHFPLTSWRRLTTAFGYNDPHIFFKTPFGPFESTKLLQLIMSEHIIDTFEVVQSQRQMNHF